MKENEIDYRFKILYCIGIVLVCCGHVSGGGISILADWFPYYSFHLALFVFSSGYFYNTNEESDVLCYISKKIRRLVVPMYIYNLVYGIIVQILKVVGFGIGGEISLSNLLIRPITDGHQYGYNLGAWFVTPLFMVEAFNVVFRKILKNVAEDKKEIFVCMIYILLGIGGNTLSYLGFNTGWWLVLDRWLYFLPFFGIGVYYRNSIEDKIRGVPLSKYFLMLGCVQLVMLCISGGSIKYSAVWCNNFYDGPVFPIIVGVTGIAFWLKIAEIMEPVCGRNKYINIIADSTYSIMVNQFLGFMIVKTVFMLLCKFFLKLDDFDMLRYKNDLYYYYVPGGVNNLLILYVLGGILFSVAIQMMINIHKKK